MVSIKTILSEGFKKCSPLLIIFFLLACSKEPAGVVYNTGNPPPVIIDSTPAKTYLALGDSYTIGQSVATNQRFPVQTVELLSILGIKMKQPDIIATTGWTTANLNSTLINNSPANTYDFVTLLIGVNNQYQGRSQEEYRVQFTELLSKAVFYAGNKKRRVFVLSIPDYSVTPFAQNSDTAKIAREINEFNAINKQITDSAGISYLDITPISREARNNPSLIATDGLHPSGLQYQRWAALLAPLMKAAL